MMNFNGQVTRRNVNMGSRAPRKTRDTILKNAELERARRQRERAEINAVLTIQRYMRKRISNNLIFHRLVKQSLTDKTAASILKVFSKRLYAYLEPNEFVYLINRTVADSSALFLFSNMLGDVSERKTSEELDTILMRSVKSLDTPAASETHIHNKLKFVLNCPYLITDEQLSALTQPSCNSSGEYENYWNDLYFISSLHTMKKENYLLFISALFSSELKPQLQCALDRNKDDMANYVVNFLAAFKGIKEATLSVHTSWFVIICSKLNEPLSIDVRLIDDNLQESLLNCFDWLKEESSSYWKGIHFFLSQLPSMQRNSILMSILTNTHIRNDLLELLCDDSVAANLNAFSVCSQMLNFYIPLSPDDQLFKTIITRDRLQALSINIAKLLISSILGSDTFIPSQELDTFIELMWNLIYLDSRVQFLKKGTSTFWDLVPEEMHNLNIKKEILEFEQYYRAYLVRFEEMDLNEDEMFDKKKFIDQNIKGQYLDDLKSKRRGSSSKIRKLELVFKFPFMIKFFERVDYFNDLIEADKIRIYSRNSFFGVFPGENRLRSTIRREHALEDAYNAYGAVGEMFKEKLGIQFVNEFGPEAGIDGGGITKEFLQTLVQEGFINQPFKLFDTTSFNKLYPSKNVSPQNLKYISFMGKILGKCLYENILVDVELADFFLKKILNVENNMNVPFNDLYSLDPEYYRNLMKLLEMSENELAYMDLYFEVPDAPNGKRIPLIKDGLSTKVTQKNVFEYITRISHYKLNLQLYTVTSRFITGLSYMIPAHWLRMFTSYELKTLISGSEKDFDLEDLKKNTSYGGFSESSVTIQHFWQVLSSFTPEERRKFLKFVFSVPTAPLKGFHSLNPLFGIRNAGDETDRLPTASTCINLLKLPDYQNYHTLREKLLTAINSDSRFELS